MQIGVVKQIQNGPEITGKVAEVMSEAREGGSRVFVDRINMSAFEGNPLTIALRECGIMSDEDCHFFD